MARQALAARQRVLGPEHPDTLRSLSDLSVLLDKLGQHLEAADMARQALAARQRVLGPEHPDTLRSLSDLSVFLDKLGQHQEAAYMARQALAARQRVLGPEHPDTLRSLSNLSVWLCMTWGSIRRLQTWHARRWQRSSACSGRSTMTRCAA